MIVADDEVLLREGLARLLVEAGFDVIGKAGDADELLRLVDRRRPDLALVDIKMPPTHTDEGLAAAQQIGERHPEIGALVLSHYLEPRYAMRLLKDHPRGAGYLLKDRVSDVAVLADALRRIRDGECVIDPTIVSRLVAGQRTGPLHELTEREREVLALMAEGHSNDGIGERLFLSPRTVETHIRQIFLKLDLRDTPAYQRRVVALLTFLRSTDPTPDRRAGIRGDTRKMPRIPADTRSPLHSIQPYTPEPVTHARLRCPFASVSKAHRQTSGMDEK